MSVRFGFRTGPLHCAAEQAANLLAALGYDCLELCLEAADVRPETMTEARAKALVQSFEEFGIGLASLSYHADREPLAQRAANQEAAIRVAGWMSAEILVVNAEKSVNQERQWAEHVVHFRNLCALADPIGVTLAIEPEPLLVVGSTQDALELIEAVGSPRLKVNLDVGHAQITDPGRWVPSVADTVRRLGPNLVHLHLEDIAGRVHKHLPFGQGDIDFGALREALADVGYQGPYVVDLFGQDAEPRQVAADALVALRRLFA
jgi:sugar phosphate isomerase/epimerase